MKIEINKDDYIDIYPYSLEIGQAFKNSIGVYIIKVSNGYMKIQDGNITVLSENCFAEEDMVHGVMIENETISLKF